MPLFQILLPLLLLAQLETAEDPCKHVLASFIYGEPPYWQNNNSRTIEAVNRVLLTAGLEVDVVFCECSSSIPVPQSIWQMPCAEGGTILIPREVADGYSDEALLGAVAHELAHAVQIRRGEKAPNNLAEEILVDAIAAEWVGTPAMLSFLSETLAPMADYLPCESIKKIDEQLRERAKAILGFPLDTDAAEPEMGPR